MFDVFETKESGVRSYCRKYPTLFDRAVNAELFDTEGKRYIDFLASAGVICYGHNNPTIKAAVMEYLAEDRIVSGLDMFTTAKEEFIKTFNKLILEPRGLDYRIMCCGPTGTNANEAALKIARLNKKRTNILAFSGAFHGMTLGALSATTDQASREGGYVPLNNVTFAPYDGTFDSLAYLEWLLTDDHSGLDKPAAIILETVQAEGGINVASVEWLQGVRRLCDEHDIIMIVDEVQTGYGRTGTYFSFERAGIVPDIVTIAKSIGGFGAPMALVFMKPELDIFKPAQHNGTFRGFQPGFVGGTAAVKFYCESNLGEEVKRKGAIVDEFIRTEIMPLDDRLTYRGIGLLWGIDFNAIDPALVKAAIHAAFDNGLICEAAGRHDGVFKFMPPLTIEEDVLREGLQIAKLAVKEALGQ
ncbi:MAG: diaminobutyrate--2-oxoglutarate transaminase [Mogibacterium sp.]|nr:diaminobutyrate--2-oxoglutarate transaminase [Mogibacterium sp.]